MKKLLTLSLLLFPVLAGAQTFQEVFETNRAMYGKNHTFEWEGKTYTTMHPEEKEAQAEPTKANAEALLAAAKADNEKAAAVGFEWRLTRGILKKAEQAITDGQFQKALDLSAQAKYHARMGLVQHAYAEKNWQMSAPE